MKESELGNKLKQQQAKAAESERVAAEAARPRTELEALILKKAHPK